MGLYERFLGTNISIFRSPTPHLVHRRQCVNQARLATTSRLASWWTRSSTQAFSTDKCIQALLVLSPRIVWLKFLLSSLQVVNISTLTKCTYNVLPLNNSRSVLYT